ncbi:MAG: hypothetical protein KGN39_09015, partial [Betaproteobacteria bacterium]|nr:hypothetical protein [Betaproteobacteria bacterium]
MPLSFAERLSAQVHPRIAISVGAAFAFLVLLFGVHLTSHYNYLLFHSVAELFSIFIAVTVFIIAINCWNYIRNQYVLFVGLGYLFVGIIDLLHTLSYKGMPIFTDYDYYAPQFWIAARYLESLSMLMGFGYLMSGRRVHLPLVIGAFSLITTALVASILYFKVFPVCFVAGKGLTPFKVVSEYLICGLLLTSIFLLWRQKRAFDPRVYVFLQASLGLMVLMELCFTLYVSDTMSDAFNEIGHLVKIAAFYLVYKAVIVTGLRDPIRLLFRDLKESEESLLEAQQLARLGRWEWSLVPEGWRWTREVARFFDLSETARPGLEQLLAALPDEGRQALTQALEQARVTGASFELLLRRESGERDGEGEEDDHGRFAQLRGEVFYDEAGRVLRIAGTLQDVTQQQRMLDALKAAKAMADSANAAKSAFLANMSHEIRTPMNA